MRCCTETTAVDVVNGYSLRCGPGQIVDFNDAFSPSQKVRDVMDPSCFEPVEPLTPPAPVPQEE